MAKISELPVVEGLTGEETTVVVGRDMKTRRVNIGPLARAAVAPAIENVMGGVAISAQSAASLRVDRFALYRDDDAYQEPVYHGVQYSVPGSALQGGVDGIELWLSVSNQARYFVLDLYSRPPSAPNGVAPIAGDILILTDRRAIVDLPSGAGGGLTRRYVIDFLRSVAVDAARRYSLRVTCLDSKGDPAGLGFSRATGPADGAPGFPFVNGLYSQVATPAVWSAFGALTAPAIRWQSVVRDHAADTAGRINALALDNGRMVRVGSPAAAAIGEAAPGTWIDTRPIVQGGPVEALSCTAASAGPAQIVFVERGDGDSFIDRRVIPVTLAAGENMIAVGTQFDPFSIEAGWLIGIRQRAARVGYGSVGTSLQLQDAGGWRAYRNVGIAVAAMVRVSSLPDPQGAARRRRTSLWRESLLGRAPLGWDVDQAIVYGSEGLRLASVAPANSWGIRVRTNRWVRTDRRVTRAVFDWTDADSVVGLDTVGADNDVIDARNANSMVLVDGNANQLKIMRSPNGAGDPGVAAFVPLGFAMAIGHRYMLEWYLDGFVHSAVLIDMTTSTRSPLVMSGSEDFNGIDTAEGRQCSALAIAFVRGNATFREIEVLHDGPSPRVVILGDSINQGVYVRRDQRVGGLLTAEGFEVLVAAQAGGITESGRRCGESEVVSTRPDFVIAALGANDCLLSIPPATYRAQLVDIVHQARMVGAKPVLIRLHPSGQYAPAAYQAVVDDLAATMGLPVWRWDLALTVNGDGITPDTTRLVNEQPAPLHPNAAGYQAMYNRLRIDVPGIWD